MESRHHVGGFNEELDRLSDTAAAARVPLIWGDINACIGGYTVLAKAVECNMLETVRAFAARGDVRADAPCRVPLLEIAADRSTHTAMLHLLLELFPSLDVNRGHGSMGYTPLHRMVFTRDLANARVLLEHGANPCVKTSQGLTARHLAEESAHGRPGDAMLALLTAAEQRAHGDGTVCAAPAPVQTRMDKHDRIAAALEAECDAYEASLSPQQLAELRAVGETVKKPAKNGVEI